jgi:primosomal replication protein N
MACCVVNLRKNEVKNRKWISTTQKVEIEKEQQTQFSMRIYCSGFIISSRSWNELVGRVVSVVSFLHCLQTLNTEQYNLRPKQI